MIIGINGKAKSGKDTVADMLVKNHGFVKVALADPIKRAAMEWWDFTEDQLWGPSEMRNKPDERYPVPHYFVDGSCEMCGMLFYEERDDHGTCYLTPRRALQQIGTEVARAIDPDVWVRITMRVAKELLIPVGDKWCHYSRTEGIVDLDVQRRSPRLGPVKGVVISDCRFKNEFEAIKEKGKLWRIKRPGAGLKGKAAEHQSESEQDGVPDNYFDSLIFNTSDLHDLKLGIDSLMDRVAGRIIPFDEEQADTPPFKRT